MTTCVENISCLPTNPLDVFNLFDVTYGAGATTIVLAMITGTIIAAIYLRTKSLALLSVLGIYSFAAFGSLMLSPYITSQYQTAVYVIIIAATSVFVMMVLKLVKE